MYHFVQIEEIKTGHRIWYLEPSSEEQVLEHFNKIFKAIISEGFHDVIINPCSHPSTIWRKSVDMCKLANGRNDYNIFNFLVSSIELENEALNSRINQFRKGLKFYLPEGVACYLLDDRFFRIVNETNKDILEYPNDEEYRFEDVKFSRWGDVAFLGIKGEHWYARIKNEDVRDEYGNMKWDTRDAAEAAAKRYCEKQNMKNRIK